MRDNDRAVIDFTDRDMPDRCHGWWTHDGITVNFLGYRAGGKYRLYGGESDQYRGEHREIARAALELFRDAYGIDPRTLDLTVVIGRDWTTGDKTVTFPKRQENRPMSNTDTGATYTLQGWYGEQYGWEDLTTETSATEILNRHWDYQKNEGGSYRIVDEDTGKEISVDELLKIRDGETAEG